MTSGWLLVAGDLAPLGGMDSANHALARHLAAHGVVDVVAHRVWPDLRDLPTVRVHEVARPFGRHALGSWLLARAAVACWRRLDPRHTKAIVNGGNSLIRGSANWVHYLHAAYRPTIASSSARAAIGAIIRRRDLAAERQALREAAVIICNSRRTRADVVDRLGVDAGKVRVIYYGSDPVRFAPVTDAERRSAKAALGARTDRPLVGFVGALGDRRKAFDVVFDAWRALCRTGAWDADLVVVGTGAELPAWRSRAEAIGIADRIRFAGFRQDVPAVMAALDGFVHPARYEAYGLAVHEALCRGVPAIVSAAAGVAEQYSADLDDLLIRNPDDAGELSERLSRWRSRIEHWREAVAPVSARLRARTWDEMAADIASAAHSVS